MSEMRKRKGAEEPEPKEPEAEEKQEKEDAKNATSPGLYKKRGSRSLGLNRHHLITIGVVVALLSCLTVPTEFGVYGRIQKQDEAMTIWKRTTCTIEKTSVSLIPKAKKGMFTGNNEYKPRATYTYIYDNTRYASNRVYFYGDDHPGKSKTYADRVVQYWNTGKCVAYVDPSNPSESILIPETSFTPYGNAWVHAGLVLGVLWYATFEHNWESTPELPEKFPVSESWEAPNMHTIVPLSSDKYYRVAMLPGIYSWPAILCGTVIIATWVYIGVEVWAWYLKTNHAPGSDEMQVAFLGLSAILGMRLTYFALLVARVRCVEVYIDREQITMGYPFELVFKQMKRGWLSVVYQKVELSFSLTETVHGPKQGKGPARKVARLHEESQTILVNQTVKPSTAGIITAIPFQRHVARLKVATEEHRVYHRWVININVHLRFVPVSYNQTIPVSVAIPEELKPRAE
eukprot:TRINITY_DN19310_c0_g1_i1.p1 TRINITY_DN19310_c0_g1~~TRINITY_DN19310_c0_g1_i1.p1  ORF type:complete len:459 (+),score=74.36 TRINITY_DN19310_c0_g1_i1:69-1445(+)